MQIRGLTRQIALPVERVCACEREEGSMPPSSFNASAKRRVTLAAKRALRGSDLDVTTMRDVLRRLEGEGVLKEGVEARRYAKAAVRKALGIGPPRRPVRLTLRVGEGGRVTARAETRGW